MARLKMTLSRSWAWGYFVMKSLNLTIASSKVVLRFGSVPGIAAALEERICGRKLSVICLSSGGSGGPELALTSMAMASSKRARK